MRSRLVLALITFLLILMLFLTPPNSSRAVLLASTIVYPGQSIQEAIDNAEAGSTVLVMNGTYEEQIIMNKALTLMGSGYSTIIQSVGSGNTISIPSGISGVVLADFRVNGSGRYSTGIFIKGLNNSVRNVTVLNHEIGIHIYDSSGDVLSNNCLTNNTYNLRVYGLTLLHYLHSIDSSNLVDGKKVYYWVSVHDRVFPSDAGYVAAVNSSGIVAKNMKLSNNFAGVLFAYTNNSIISNVTCEGNEQGIRLLCSNDNAVWNSTLSSNSFSGISLSTASNNHLNGNIIRFNPNGISLSYSPLIAAYSENNSIAANFLANNYEAGIYIVNSSLNKIYDNDIVENPVGIDIDLSEGVSRDSVFFHNNFLNNTSNVHFTSHMSPPFPPNSWDNGYPDGGNHWSDYAGIDSLHGPFRNETGGDGIGDAPYSLGESNSDRYPLMHAYGSIRNLDTNLAYLTIQSAINAPETLNGHSVFVQEGLYHESVVINKSLSLIGQNRDTTVLEMEPEVNITTIVANNVSLSSFFIRSSTNVAPSSGIRLVNACYSRIENNLVAGKFIAIKVDRGSCYNLIQNNLIKNNQYGIFIKRRASETAVFGNVVFNNTIVHNFWNGIELAWCESNVIEANTIADNGGFGLEIPDYTPSYRNIIFHNNFINNSWNNVPVRHTYDSSAFSNSWDYDAEGNYWDDYGEGDWNQDGIGDFAYLIRSEEEMEVADRYPLMGRFSCFKVFDKYVSIITDTRVAHLGFSFHDTLGKLALNMTEESSKGFIRMRVSRALLDGPYWLSFGGEAATVSFRELPCSNSTIGCLYLSYSSDTAREHWLVITGITSIPERLTFICLVVLFIVAGLLAGANRVQVGRSRRLERLA